MVHWYADTEKELQMKKCLTCGMENSDEEYEEAVKTMLVEA